MVLSCVAFNCTNRFVNAKENAGKKLRFHRFPLHKPELLKQWIVATKRIYWHPSKFSALCGEHFTKESYRTATGRYLKDDAVPSIFNFSIIPVKQIKRQSCKMEKYPLVKKEDQLKNSGSKTSISGSLLPTLVKMETDFEQKPLDDGACMSETVSPGCITTSENSPECILPLCETIMCEKAFENQIIIKQEPDEMLYEPSSSSTVALENQIIIKQEPPDDNLSEPSSSSALELLQPVIVSVFPVLTTEEPNVPAIKVALAESTKSIESPVIGSPAPFPSKEDFQSYSLLNTAQGTKSEALVFEPSSDNLITTTEEPQLEECT